MQANFQKTASARPNIIARAVAGLGVSIHLKLLTAFLGSTLLMIGLALLGLIALQQANERTEKLLHDQGRIAFYNELHGYLSDLAIFSASAQLDPANVQTGNVSDRFLEAGTNMIDRAQWTILFVSRGVRKFGRAGMPDEDIISNTRFELEKLPPIASRINKLRIESAYEAAGSISRQEFAPIVFELQRQTFTVVQQIENGMSKTAKSTAQGYEASRRQVIASALVAVGFALLLGYAISSSLIWPVGRIGQTLGMIAGGDFNARVTVPNRDELGELAANVNTTSERLGELYNKVEAQRAELAVEHARSEALLNSLLPKEIAARLKTEPDKTIADSLPQVAILFADIVDFTSRAATQQPEEVVEFLNKIFRAFDELSERHGLEKVKTIGDAYMVAAGVPSEVKDPVHRVAAMALDMQRTVTEMSPEFGENLQIRIGLHTGPAVAGVIGSQKPFYDVWGETVNTASRMESHGEPGRILVTATAKEKLGQHFHFALRGKVNLKGVGNVETWWLTGKRTTT